MQNNAILQADVLDIIFEGRNKEYGAYDLRRTYSRRMTVAIVVMMAMVLLFVFMQLIGRDNKGHENMVLNIPDSAYKLIEIPDIEPPPPPPPPAPPPPPPPATRSIVFTPPQIVQDDQVNPDEVPPAAADLENVRIDVVASDGGEDLGIVQPPPSDGDRGIIQAPQCKENPDSIYMTVQIESSFPGGAPAWQRFLRKHLRYPQQAVGQGIEGYVMVQFIVDKDGTVTNVEAISGPEELRAEAVRVIRRSGKWNPAVQNGIHVKSYKKQPIGFKLSFDEQ
jgi:protein TonB